VQKQLNDIRMSDGTVISYTVFDGAAPAVVIMQGLAGSSREFAPTPKLNRASLNNWLVPAVTKCIGSSRFSICT
jgi:hypothetical protein